jgi:hypothetical protein
MLVLCSFMIDDYNDPIMHPDFVVLFCFLNPKLQIPRHVIDDIIVIETTRDYHIEMYRNANTFQVGVVDRTLKMGSENEWSQTCEYWTDRPQ